MVIVKKSMLGYIMEEIDWPLLVDVVPGHNSEEGCQIASNQFPVAFVITIMDLTGGDGHRTCLPELRLPDAHHPGGGDDRAGGGEK